MPAGAWVPCREIIRRSVPLPGVGCPHASWPLVPLAQKRPLETAALVDEAPIGDILSVRVSAPHPAFLLEY